jgi:hypothetical protein
MIIRLGEVQRRCLRLSIPLASRVPGRPSPFVKHVTRHWIDCSTR